MQRKKMILSLGTWPQKPIQLTNLQLTPITKRILNQIHLKPDHILPLTFLQYCKNISQSSHDHETNKQNYQIQNQRRRKQIIILSNIRNKYILGKDYNSNISKQPSKSRLTIKSRQISKASSSQGSNDHQFSNIRLTQALSQAKSERKIKINTFKSPISRKDLKQPKKQQSDYFVHFNPHKQKSKNNIQKQQIEQQSTKSKGNQPPKVSKISENHSEYGNFFYNKNTKLRIKKNQSNSTSKQQSSSKQLCHELLITMERWQELDRQHLKEMRKMKDLSQHQKDRLSKMQSIQKCEMRSKMKRIKSRLNSQNYQI